MRYKYYIVLLISIYLFSCSKSENEISDSGSSIKTEDLLGQYCRVLVVSNFNYFIEIIDTDTLLLNEPFTGNFKFIISQDTLIIPIQTINLLRFSPGGSPYYISKTIQGKGTYDSDSKIIIFQIEDLESSSISELILTRFENIVSRGRYKSNESPNDSVIIRNLSIPDSLHVDIYFEKNEYGDTGVSFDAFHSCCRFQIPVFINDTSYFYVSIETIGNNIFLRLTKFLVEKETNDVVLYAYDFDGYFVGD